MIRFAFAFISILLYYINTATTAQSESIRIVLLRHSEKATDDPKNPSLSERGKNYARSLQELFSETKFDGAFSTPYKRTRNTIQHVADANGLKIEDYQPMSVEGILEKINNEKLRSVIVAAHSNTVTHLVNKLVSTADLKELDESDYGKIFIVNYFPNSIDKNTLVILNTKAFLK
jgi:2,3-bisphosphoglycerate-dependent phosphoglycerate mutase